MKPTYLSLFSGIGGLDLGLDRAGFACVGQVEKDEYCRRVLAKHWPEVPRHDDVRTAVEWWFSEPRPAVRLVAGGPPCQPVSLAGKGLAQEDERWLWPAYFDFLRAVRPDYAVMENPPGLFRRGFGDVLGTLAEIGYDTEWDCVPAAAVGAPHQRDRLFIVAYPNGAGLGERRRTISVPSQKPSAQRGGQALANADCIRRDRRPRIFGQGRRGQPADCGRWATEPDVGRVAHGIPGRVDRIRGLGNAVVPQVAEHIGRLILDHLTASLPAAVTHG